MQSSISIKPHQLGLFSASSIVIANMVGTGVFTSLGYQVMDIHSVVALIMLWLVGGLLAFCGAMVYAELGSRYPQSGGEYHLLTKIYHPLPGFLSGWVSAIAGFAAPTALAAIAFGKYLHAAYPVYSEKMLALSLVLSFTALHAFSVKLGTRFQDFFTLLKVLVMIIFILFAFLADAHPNFSVSFTSSDWSEIFQGSFALNLVYVSYAYTGWNAAIYVVGEIRNPMRNLPRSLLLGTAIVTILYAVINLAFLYIVPQAELAGKVEIGYVVATQLFGVSVGKLVSVIIAVLMISTVSVMVFIGPRVIFRMGEDFPLLGWFNKKSEGHVPVRAVLFQGLITVLIILTSTFDQVLIYAAFCLISITMLTVFGIFVVRRRQRNSEYNNFKIALYPLAPLFFLVVNACILLYVFIDKPSESLVGLGIVLTGIPFYFLFRSRK